MSYFADVMNRLKDALDGLTAACLDVSRQLQETAEVMPEAPDGPAIWDPGITGAEMVNALHVLQGTAIEGQSAAMREAIESAGRPTNAIDLELITHIQYDHGLSYPVAEMVARRFVRDYPGVNYATSGAEFVLVEHWAEIFNAATGANERVLGDTRLIRGSLLYMVTEQAEKTTPQIPRACYSCQSFCGRNFGPQCNSTYLHCANYPFGAPDGECPDFTPKKGWPPFSSPGPIRGPALHFVDSDDAPQSSQA